MSNANEPAFPRPTHNYINEKRQPMIGDGAEGLTKREYFAAMAMQGVLSMGGFESINSNEVPKRVATFSSAYADALLAELEK